MPQPLILAPPEKLRRLAELRARLREQEAETTQTRRAALGDARRAGAGDRPGDGADARA